MDRYFKLLNVDKKMNDQENYYKFPWTILPPEFLEDHPKKILWRDVRADLEKLNDGRKVIELDYYDKCLYGFEVDKNRAEQMNNKEYVVLYSDDLTLHFLYDYEE